MSTPLFIEKLNTICTATWQLFTKTSSRGVVKRRRIGPNQFKDSFTTEQIAKLLQDVKCQILKENINEDPALLHKEIICSVQRESNIDLKSLFLLIIQSPELFSKEYIVAIYQLIFEPHIQIPISEWIDKDYSYHLNHIAFLLLNAKIDNAKAFASLAVELLPSGQGAITLKNFINTVKFYHLEDKEWSYLIRKNYTSNEELFSSLQNPTEFYSCLLFIKNHSASKTLCASKVNTELKKRFLNSTYGFMGATINASSEVWHTIFNNEEHLKAALSYGEKSVGDANVFLACFAVSGEATVKFVSLINSAVAKQIFTTARYRKKSDLAAAIAFLEREGNSPNLERLSTLLKYYPYKIRILTHLFQLEGKGKMLFGWYELLCQPSSTTFHFLDLCERLLSENSSYISTLTIGLFHHHSEWSKVYALLENAPKEWLSHLIFNLYMQYCSNFEVFEQIVQCLMDHPDSIIILGSVGSLASPVFRLDRMTAVMGCLEDTTFPSQILSNFLCRFSNYALMEAENVAEAVWIALSDKKTEFKEVLRLFPFPAMSLLKQLIVLIQDNPANLNTIRNMICSFAGEDIVIDTASAEHIKKVLLSIPVIPKKFLIHLNFLVAQHQDVLAVRLLEALPTNNTASEFILKLAELAVSRRLFFEVNLILKELLATHQSSETEFLLHAIEFLPESYIASIFHLKKHASTDTFAKVLYENCLKSFQENDEIPTILLRLTYAYSLQGHSGLQLQPLVDLALKEKLTLQEAYAASCLHVGDITTALAILDSPGLEFPKAYPFTLVQSTRRSGSNTWLPIANEAEILANFKEEIESFNANLRKFASEPEQIYHALLVKIVQSIAKLSLLPGNVINVSRLEALIKQCETFDFCPEIIHVSMQQQFNVIKNDVHLRLKIEKLEFTASQEGHFAFLIRLTLGLEQHVPIENRHLVEFTLLLMLTCARQPTKEGSCVGVSLLNSLIVEHQSALLRFIKELVANDGIYLKDRYVPISFQPDLTWMDQQLSVKASAPFHLLNCDIPLKQMPPFQSLTRYCGIDAPLQDAWLKAAMAKLQLCSDGNVVGFSHRELFDALLETYSPLISPTPVSQETKKKLLLAYVCSLDPQHHRTLEGILISFDSTPLKAIRQTLQSYFDENIETAFAHYPFIPAFSRQTIKETFRKICYEDLLIIYNHDAKCKFSKGKKVLVSESQASLFDPEAITSAEELYRFYHVCANKALEQSKKQLESNGALNDEEWTNAENKISFNINVKDFKTAITILYRSLLGKPATSNKGPWTIKPGAFSKKSWKKAHRYQATASKGDVENFFMRNPNDVLNFLIENLSCRSSDMIKAEYILGRIHAHAVNFQFSNPALNDLITAESIEEHFQMIVKRAKEIHDNQHIHYSKFLSWIEAVRTALPAELKLPWQNAIATHQQQNTIGLVEARNLLFETLVKVCGSYQVVHEFFESHIDSYAVHCIGGKYNKKSFFPFIDTNWINYSSYSAFHLALYFNPITLQWELWIVDNYCEGYKWNFPNYCGDQKEFSLYLEC